MFNTNEIVSKAYPLFKAIQFSVNCMHSILPPTKVAWETLEPVDTILNFLYVEQ